MISEKRIKEFRKIVKEEYGKEITTAEASEIASGLVNYFDALAKIYDRMKNKENKND